MTSEELWRAALHDFNNLMAGLQGVLDLSDPERPLDPRNRMRLSATLEDGKTLVAMARALALGRIPEEGTVPWAEWSSGLETRLGALAELFRCPVELVDAGARNALWPAPLLQEWTEAFTRQILPWASPGPLRLEAEAGPEGLLLRWMTDAPMPPALRAEPSPDAPKNLHAFWLRAMAAHLGLEVQPGTGCLLARLPRAHGRSLGA